MNIALNRDCMEVMKEYPDGYFDLAVVDPPYGAGFADDGCNGWFKKYKDGLQFVHVEREREREPRAAVQPIRRAVRQVQDSDSTAGARTRRTLGTGISDRRKPQRTGGTWAAKYQKNHSVGRSAEAGVFRGTVSRLTAPDNMGGQLLSSPADKMFSGVA